MTMEAQEFNRIAKALSDPRRMEILELIARNGKLNCGAIVEQLPVSQPTVSHHIKELLNANLIEGQCEGQCHHFTLRSQAIRNYIRELQCRLECAEQSC
jgi:ArsR family transcriptional regulator